MLVRSITRLCLYGSALATLASCGGGSHDGRVSNDEQARLAYSGIDRSVVKAINLGLAGYSAATSANIAPQSLTS